MSFEHNKRTLIASNTMSANNTNGTGQPAATVSANREKRMVAAASVLAAVVLVAMKLVVGISTNSLGILSEALHSGLDFVAASITLWAVHMSAMPADREHTYGHGKFENLSALLETMLLLATCGWIVYEAGYRLFVVEKVVHATFWAFAVIIVSTVIEFSRWRALDRVAKKHNSQALAADALHFSADILSSFVVLLGLVGVFMAELLGQPWMQKADAVAALGVAMIVIWVSIRLGRRAVDDLLDRIPPEMQDAVTDAAASVHGIEEVRRVRLRRSGPLFFADITLAVDCTARIESAHQLSDRVEAAVKGVLPGADVVIHVEPGDFGEDDILAAVRVCAARRGLEAHGARIIEKPSGRSIELHIEVEDTLRLEEAHRRVTRFENDLRDAVPGLESVVTHIEPVGDARARLEARPDARLADKKSLVEEALKLFAQTEPTRFEAHDLKFVANGDEVGLSFHCTLDAATPITAAHDFTQRLESFLRAAVPNLGRVVIHAEPAGHDGEQ